MAAIRYMTEKGTQELTYTVPSGFTDATLSAMYNAYECGQEWTVCGCPFFPPGPHQMLDLSEADDLRAYNAECVRAMRDHLKTYVRTEKDQRTKSVYLSAVLTLADLERILERVTA